MDTDGRIRRRTDADTDGRTRMDSRGHGRTDADTDGRIRTHTHAHGMRTGRPQQHWYVKGDEHVKGVVPVQELGRR